MKQYIHNTSIHTRKLNIKIFRVGHSLSKISNHVPRIKLHTKIEEKSYEFDIRIESSEVEGLYFKAASRLVNKGGSHFDSPFPPTLYRNSRAKHLE
jgi:hypothetical protein